MCQNIDRHFPPTPTATGSISTTTIRHAQYAQSIDEGLLEPVDYPPSQNGSSASAITGMEETAGAEIKIGVEDSKTVPS